MHYLVKGNFMLEVMVQEKYDIGAHAFGVTSGRLEGKPGGGAYAG